MRTAQRPKIIINRVFTEERSALEAFTSLIIKDMERCSFRTFENAKQPHYTKGESEVEKHDPNS